jgi:predicted enzyme related to lactoylglutathione lyase
MLNVIELAFCCYAVTDMPRARKFYEGVLGLKPTSVVDSEHGQWTEYEFGPYALAIGSSPAFKPSPDGCSAALEVEDFDDAIEHLKKQNVKFRMEPMPTPVCRMAMIFDPDGNTICIHKRNAGR